MNFSLFFFFRPTLCSTQYLEPSAKFDETNFCTNKTCCPRRDPLLALSTSGFQLSHAFFPSSGPELSDQDACAQRTPAGACTRRQPHPLSADDAWHRFIFTLNSNICFAFAGGGMATLVSLSFLISLM